MEGRVVRTWLCATLVMALLPFCSFQDAKPHSRQKRLLWITNDGRLALPPGTSLTITPTIALPFVRYPPMGFLSNMSISLPFTIVFDQLGLTDNQNPFGVLPPLLARSMGRMSGMMLADYVARLLDNKRKARSAPLEELPLGAFHGGERALLYTIVEDFLGNFGMDGKACLLRAICEVHGFPLKRFGLLGEILKLFFTASKSPYAFLLKEYVEAEKAGLDDGECWRYYKGCPKSLFSSPEINKYTHHNHDFEEVTDDDNEISDSEDTDEKHNNPKVTLPAGGTKFM